MTRRRRASNEVSFPFLFIRVTYIVYYGEPDILEEVYIHEDVSEVSDDRDGE